MCGSHLDSDAMSSATFSFLFTDIVGSTEHVVRLGDERWDALLTRYRAIVRRALQRFNGREVDAAGDGFFALFESDSCRDPMRTRHQTRGPRPRSPQPDWHPQRRVSNWWRKSYRTQRPRRGARDERRSAQTRSSCRAPRLRALAGGALRVLDRGLHALKGLPGEWQLFAVAQTLTNARFRRRLCYAWHRERRISGRQSARPAHAASGASTPRSWRSSCRTCCCSASSRTGRSFRTSRSALPSGT